MTDAFDTRAREILENGPVIFGRESREHYEAAISSALREADREATERERERCAKVADIWAETKPKDGPMAELLATMIQESSKHIASAIRGESK